MKSNPALISTSNITTLKTPTASAGIIPSLALDISCAIDWAKENMIATIFDKRLTGSIF
ncbi:MAG: hypothetical protein ACXQS3_03000 [Candidatus Methanofastidiosia archaeon]